MTRTTDLVDEMAGRLRPFCTDWPEDAFREMILRLAAITVKYEAIAARTGAAASDEKLPSNRA